jgi:23S rRNA pseudouridine1911/1915/1917 synthase
LSGPSDAAGRFDLEAMTRYRDDHLLVIDKPAGLVVHPGAGHEQGTLAQRLSGIARGGDDPRREGIVHRLDRDTSGLMVIACDQLSYERLQRALAARQIEREYVVLVAGRPPARSGTIDAPIGRDPRERKRMSVRSASGRPARTHFSVLELLPESALLAVCLESGRTHQVRVHMQAIGHPVVGDRRYRGPALAGLQRQFLHARRLAFAHPLDGRRMDFQSPLPEDLRRALDQARRPAARIGGH